MQNSTPFDVRIHYEDKTVEQLQAELKYFEDELVQLMDELFSETGAVGWHNKHIGFLKMKIAERIGRK